MSQGLTPLRGRRLRQIAVAPLTTRLLHYVVAIFNYVSSMLSGIFNVPARHAQTTPTMPAAHLPPLELAVRYGNLSLSFWAPPGHEAGADDARKRLLHALLEGCRELIVVGAPRTLPDDLRLQQPSLFELLSHMERPAGDSGRATLPHEHIAAAFSALRSGNLAHRMREDDASGLTKIVSKSYGKPIQLHSPQTVLAAVRSVSTPGPCQLFVSVIKNPYAGFRQNEAKLIRERLAADNLSLAATWLAANSITLISSEAALTVLHNALSQNRDKPQS
jgi:hypothetical protein